MGKKGAYMRYPNRFLFILPLLLIFSFFLGCGKEHETTSDASNWAASVQSRLNDTGKVGQLLCLTIDPIRFFIDPEYKEKVQGLINISTPGAIYLSSNLSQFTPEILTEFDAVKLRSLLSEMQGYSPIPCLFAANFESGAWFWDHKATRFACPIALGATGSSAFAYRQGKITAVEASAQGITWVLAPSINKASNSHDDQFSFGCFSDNPAQISEFVTRFVTGVQDAGIAACLKYYPGSFSNTSEPNDDEPLKSGIEAGVLSILGNPLITSTTPSSDDSHSDAYRDILTTRYNFKGVLVREVADAGDSTMPPSAKAEFILNSFHHGQDMIILPDNPDVCRPLVSEIINLTQLKRVDIGTIEPSVTKILLLKEKLGLDKRENDQAIILSGLGIREFHDTAEKSAQASLTLLKNEGNIVPLNPMNQYILFANFIDSTLSSDGIRFSENLEQNYPEIHQINVINASDSRLVSELQRRVNESDVIVFTFFLEPGQNGSPIRLSRNQLNIVRNAIRTGKPSVGVSFSSPFLIDEMPQIKAFLTTYCLCPVTITAATNVLFGMSDVSGKLPLHISDSYPYGFGLSLQTERK